MNRELIIKLSLLLSLTAALYYDTFTYLITKWDNQDNNYCYLIPLVVAYIIWEKREEWSKVPASPSWKGLFMFLPGMALYWFGELAGEYYTLYLSSWLTAVGILWLLFGFRKIKVIGFALFIALSAFPLPGFFHNRLSLHLKLLSSKLGVAIMHMLGMVAYRTGNVIDLGFTQLQVVDACSGLRYFFPLIIMGLLIAYFFKAAFWKKVLLVLSTVPLVVVANGIRIAATGILYQHFGPVVAKGFFHDLAGFFMFIISVMVLVPEMWALKRFFPEKERKRRWDTDEELHEKSGDIASADPYKKNYSGIFRPVQFTAALVVLSITLALSHGIEFREKIPIKRDFATFPIEIGQWHGTRKVMEQKFIDALDFSDYILIDYINPKGQVIDFYVAYYESQRKGESIHSPTTCLTGGGWIFKDRRDIELDIPGLKPLKVKRAVIQQNGTTQITYYWYPMRGRNLTSAYQMKIYNFIDALLLHRTDGALVRVMTVLGADETPEDGDTRLKAFLAEALPVLDKYLPE